MTIKASDEHGRGEAEFPPYPVTMTAEDVESLQAAFRGVVEAYRRVILQIAPGLIKTFREAFSAVESTRDPDEYALAPPHPGRRRDRPAWQSPYGPPTRHRR